MLVHLAGCQEKKNSSKRKSFVQKKKLFKEIISENVERMTDANS
jgi:hypothetical protein